MCTASVGAPLSPLLFHTTTAQRGNSYKLNTGDFTVPVNGTYVFHLSSGVNGSSAIKMGLQGGGKAGINVFRNSTSHNDQDLLSRDFIYILPQGSVITMNLVTGIGYSADMKQVLWSVFLLDNLMCSLVAFCVGIATSYTQTGLINFSTSFVNVGYAFNITTNTFTAPSNGIYVFSLSCGAESGQPYIVLLCTNTTTDKSPNCYGLVKNSTSHNGRDMSSRTFAISLVTGDKAYVSLNKGRLFSDEGIQTSFAGFLYEPLNGRKVIWSVHQNSSMSGQYNPFPFNVVSVNIGNGWKTANNTFVAPYSGVYQLHMTATAQSLLKVDYKLWWKGIVYASIYTGTTVHNGPETKSRSIMVEASAGDTFFISTTAATNLYSSAFNLISFGGFLVSP